MTIRFVTAWNGYYPDQIVSGLGSTEENRLIGLGYAVSDLDGPGNTPVPVFATKDLTGGIRYLSAAGRDALQSPIDGISPSALNWLQLRSAYQWDTVQVPSPYSPGHVLHPSVVHFYRGWRGYKYWMAYTPYPNADSTYENPCMAVSNDGIHWSGVGQQPVFAKPDGVSQYNSDTDLVYDAANDRLVMLYRSSDGASNAQRLKIAVSTDGETWSDPVVIYTSANNGTAISTDMASPSLIWNSAASKWEIFAHILRDTGSAWPLGKITSSSLLSGWDATPAELAITPLSGRKFWHSEIRRLESGAYVGLIQDNANVSGGHGNLFAAYSDDGSVWSTRLIDDGSARGYSWYRPSFVITYDTQRNEWIVEVYGSRLNTTGLFRHVMRFDSADFAARRVADIGAILYAASVGQVGNILLADAFNRSDDATGLGTSTSGQTYTQPNGPTNVIGISGNAAYNVTTGNCRALVTAAVADYNLRTTIKTKCGNGQWLNFRCVDTSNFCRVGIGGASDQLRFQRITAGGTAVDTTLGLTPATGSEIQVVCCGAEIAVFYNGNFVRRFTESQGVTAATFGLQMAGTAGAMENFIAIGIGA